MEANVQNLRKEIHACRKELFNLKLSMASGQVKDTSQFKKMRKKIARLFTQMSQQAQVQTKNENAEQ